MHNYIFNLEQFDELKDANNKKTYNDLILFFNQFNKQYFDERHIYNHNHHIIPESEGGKDSDGIVCLPYKYHIKAHWLRAEEMMKINNKLAAYKNYKAVRYALKENWVPKSIQQLEQKLDYVCKAIQKEKELKKDITYRWMSKGDICIQVYSTEVEQYLKNNWKLKRIFKNTSTKRWVTNNIESKYIEENELDDFLMKNKDYRKGMALKDRPKNPDYSSWSTKNTKWVYKEGKRKPVKKEDINKYLDDGWKLGHNFKTNNGNIRIRNIKEQKGKIIKPSELEYYLKLGWERGFLIQTKKLKWFTNGVENRLEYTCPEGFRIGRI